MQKSTSQGGIPDNQGDIVFFRKSIYPRGETPYACFRGEKVTGGGELRLLRYVDEGKFDLPFDVASKGAVLFLHPLLQAFACKTCRKIFVKDLR